MKAFAHEELFKLDGDVPLVRAVPYGVQHILAMFVANLAPIVIVAGVAGLGAEQTGTLIQSAMLIAGIGTLIQLFPLWRIGSGLPIVMGISFTFVTVLCGVVATYGYSTAIGAIMVGGVIEGVLGLFAKYWRRIISPIVAAVVVTSIGFSLLGVGAESFGGGSGAEDFASFENLLLGTVSLVACLVFQVMAKGKTKQLSVLFGLVIGYAGGGSYGKGGLRRLRGPAAVRPAAAHAVHARVQRGRHRVGDADLPGVGHRDHRRHLRTRPGGPEP